MSSRFLRPLPSQPRSILHAGLLAGIFSTVTLLWRSRAETRRAAAAMNAPGHWLFGDKALRQNAMTARYTATGAAVHLASGFFWAVLFSWLNTRRARQTRKNALVDAAIVTATAAVVDFKLVPRRLTPGFEHRLARRSVALAYLAFAGGLALGGMLSRR